MTKRTVSELIENPNLKAVEQDGVISIATIDGTPLSEYLRAQQAPLETPFIILSAQEVRELQHMAVEARLILENLAS